jgi:hypothetical protein
MSLPTLNIFWHKPPSGERREAIIIEVEGFEREIAKMKNIRLNNYLRSVQGSINPPDLNRKITGLKVRKMGVI